MEFKEFPKMGRLSRQMIITEKIDGSNASVFIQDFALDDINDAQIIAIAYDENSQPKLTLRAGSRTRWITTGDDNFGFAKWVKENAEELFKLGEGHHFGEWWGSGIQRGYNLPKGEKRFSLFNTSRWSDEEIRPKCCSVVPVMYEGIFDTKIADRCIEMLKEEGSLASIGFMKPEGIVVFHVAGNVGFKKTCEKDEIPKSLIKE